MNIGTVIKVLLNGRKEAKRLSLNSKSVSWFKLYSDMVLLSIRYGINHHQYSSNRFHELSRDDRRKRSKELSLTNKQQQAWDNLYRANFRFLSIWSKEKYSGRHYLSFLRAKAYQRHYHLDNYPLIQYGVKIICEHQHVGKLEIGQNVLFARDVDIDYTSDLTVGEGTLLSEGVKILTHNHSYFNGEDDHGLVLTPLTIKDHVFVGARVLVLPGVCEIGRGALLSAGAVVRKKVPPYAIVTGNPSMVVGFRFTPEQIIEYEEDNYPPEDRLPLEVLEQNYQKFYIERLTEIKNFLK